MIKEGAHVRIDARQYNAKTSTIYNLFLPQSHAINQYYFSNECILSEKENFASGMLQLSLENGVFIENGEKEITLYRAPKGGIILLS